MTNQIKTIIKNRKDDIMRNPETVYYIFLELVEQAIHARIIADAIWKYYWDSVSRTGIHNIVVRFSQVALDNFAVLQLWKLFDSKNSVFHVWNVVEYLNKPTLKAWLNNKITEKQIQEDINIIDEWRHVAIGHRSEVGYFAPDEHQKKFTTARLSEKRLHDFLLDFLCQIKFEVEKIPIKQTMEGFHLGMIMGFKAHIKNEMIKVFKDYDNKK